MLRKPLLATAESTAFLDYDPNLLWYIGGGLCAVAAFAFYTLHLRLGAKERFAPAPAEVPATVAVASK